MKINIVYITCFILTSFYLFAQTDDCSDFNKLSLIKINSVLQDIAEFESPNYLSKKELFSIVVPEFVTYSASRNKFEVVLVKSSLIIDANGNDYSFGPFQMKLSFIKSILRNTPNFVINDSKLIILKNKKFKFNNTDIDYLNEIQTQWKLLIVFEYLNRYIYKKYSIVSLYTIYNRGGLRKKKTIFNKIPCKNLSYEQWCSDFFIKFR